MEALIYNILCFTLIFSTLLHTSLSADLCNPQDKKVLLQIKKAFNNPYVLASWDPLTDCCEWYLVSCDEKTHRINSLHIHTEGISGQIPPQVADLPYLKTLIFSRQPNLRGPIQPAIAKLKNLNQLMITSTNVTGSIPDFIGGLHELEFLDLSRNALTGTIPSSLGFLPNLGGLRLDMNKLTGPIPESFGQFKKSSELYLYLSFNQLSGEIPSSMGKTSFAYIDVSRNKLVGNPSALFGADKKTEHVDLSRNLFAFDLSKVNKISKSLAWLDLSHNAITGSISSALAVPSLRYLDVSYNKLCGKIPVGGNLQNIEASSYIHNLCLCGAPLKINCK